jgi:hypothetical protein
MVSLSDERAGLYTLTARSFRRFPCFLAVDNPRVASKPQFEAIEEPIFGGWGAGLRERRNLSYEMPWYSVCAQVP